MRGTIWLAFVPPVGVDLEERHYAIARLQPVGDMNGGSSFYRHWRLVLVNPDWDL